MYVYYNARFKKRKTAQQLDSKVYNHIARLPHVSNFFSHLQGSMDKKMQHWLLCHICAAAEFKKYMHIYKKN
jgi:hypothetical protein